MNEFKKLLTLWISLCEKPVGNTFVFDSLNDKILSEVHNQLKPFIKNRENTITTYEFGGNTIKLRHRILLVEVE